MMLKEVISSKSRAAVIFTFADSRASHYPGYWSNIPKWLGYFHQVASANFYLEAACLAIIPSPFLPSPREVEKVMHGPHLWSS